MRKLIHHRLDRDSDQAIVEVWADEPAPKGAEPLVILWLDVEVSCVDFTPTEARALAALLILAAERQERAK